MWKEKFKAASGKRADVLGGPGPCPGACPGREPRSEVLEVGGVPSALPLLQTGPRPLMSVGSGSERGRKGPPRPPCLRTG